MNNLKKALGAAALVSVLAMTACGNDGSTSSSVSDTKTSATSENTTESQTTTSAATSKITTTSIITTTVATTTTVAESTTDTTETTANGGGGNVDPVDSRRKDYIEQDDRNIYSRCSIFGVHKNNDTIWGDLSLANTDNSLQGIVNKFGLKPIEGEGADYKGSLTAFGFKGKGYYAIADDKTSTKVYLMIDGNNEVVGVVFTDFAKSSYPVAGSPDVVSVELDPEKTDLVFDLISMDYEYGGFSCVFSHYNYEYVTDDGYTGSCVYDRCDDEYYSMIYARDESTGRGIDTFAVMDNAYIKLNADLKVEE